MEGAQFPTTACVQHHRLPDPLSPLFATLGLPLWNTAMAGEWRASITSLPCRGPAWRPRAFTEQLPFLRRLKATEEWRAQAWAALAAHS
jgi:hypothetical protein